jgi:hypothetical protein
MTMTEPQVQALMERHGITATQHAVYHYKEFRYGNLTDALNYAELAKSREFAARDQKRTNQ